MLTRIADKQECFSDCKTANRGGVFSSLCSAIEIVTTTSLRGGIPGLSLQKERFCPWIHNPEYLNLFILCASASVTEHFLRYPAVERGFEIQPKCQLQLVSLNCWF